MNKLIKELDNAFSYMNPVTRGIIDVEKKIDDWNSICIEYGGKIKINRTVDNAYSRVEMRIPFYDSEIIFRESDTRPLKIEFDLKYDLGFTLFVSPEDIIERILKHFRKKELQIGDTEFDKSYLIDSSNDQIALNILGDKTLRTLLLKYSIGSFVIVEKNNTSCICLFAGRQIDIRTELKDMIKIYEITIRALKESSL